MSVAKEILDAAIGEVLLEPGNVSSLEENKQRRASLFSNRL